jgi:alkylation response protein AidB-like acyl-CoA dehydrogenase
MNFDLSPDQQQLQARVRDFAQAEIAPIAETLDRDGVFPAALYRKLGELGVTAMTVRPATLNDVFLHLTSSSGDQDLVTAAEAGGG